MKKFAFIFACVSLSIVCSKAKAEVNVSGSLDEIRGRLDPGEAFEFPCTDSLHNGKCAAAGFGHGEDRIFFFKNYDDNVGHSIHTCQTGFHCVNNSCAIGRGNTTCNDVNIAGRCEGLRGEEKDNCVACSALSNWGSLSDPWDHVEKKCLVEIDATPVAVPETPVVQNTNITVTVADTNGVPLPGAEVEYNNTRMVTDRYGQVTLDANMGEVISIVYGSMNKNPTINSANMTIKMDLHWFAGMQPGEVREIDCTNADNEAVCVMENEKTGAIGLDYNAKPIAYLIMECNAGYEWFLSSRGYVDCQTGTGASRTTDFSEIAKERCKGLNGSEKESCIECTKRDWRAWNWTNKVCGIVTLEGVVPNSVPVKIKSNNDAPSVIVDTVEITKNIGEIADDLKKMESKFEKSRWKTASGNFNGARLASDSVAGVVLGTAGGLITSHVIKNNQIKGGFEDIQCVINGQIVSEYSDEFVVGIQ